MQLLEIEGHGDPGLDDGRGGEDFSQGLGKAQPLELEDPDPLRPGQLQQGREMILAFLEIRFGLGIETEQLFTRQFGQDRGQFRRGADQGDPPG